MQSPECRVLLADDDPIACQFIRKLLSRQAGVQLVAEAADGDQALTLLKKLHPDVLVLDFLMPRMHGLEVMHAVRKDFDRVAIIILAASVTKLQALEAFQLGARAVLAKKFVKKLAECILCVREGSFWIDDQCFGDVQQAVMYLIQQLKPTEPDTAGKLTYRELQVASLVASGKTNREIADLLSLQEATVKRHLANIFEKCGIGNRTELVKFVVHDS